MYLYKQRVELKLSWVPQSVGQEEHDRKNSNIVTKEVELDYLYIEFCQTKQINLY